MPLSMVGLLQSLAAVIDDPRQLSKCRHSTLELLTQRVMALVAGYEDCNDHTLLRRDPELKTATKRRALSGADLASQPTLSMTTTVKPPSVIRRGLDLGWRSPTTLTAYGSAIWTPL